ncbi:ankyrin repeat domain-containing protein [Paenibacillus sp. HWE-109]|uniref:ankyrin repeat domain-containing protein n=1 Tax=Paenibacillus sp. HWE-109 TaxID=1306526 RepID=UPI001EE037CF|nr:ankyrin repeat domain-containing protein [Paenibacillus sp. HWE-109]UKS29954.1 ankyrin repeat domain-containing protein [Paenibacillus sp. HWE-109]
MDMAIFHKNLEMIKLLLENGADANHRIGSPKSDLTELNSAIYGKNPEIVQILIDYGADVNRINREGNTPLELAKKLHDKEKYLSDKVNLEKIIDIIEAAKKIKKS